MDNFWNDDVQKCRRMLNRCNVLEIETARLMGRIHGSKNLMLRCKSDIRLLERLVTHEDSLRAIPVDEPVPVTKQRPVIKPQASTKQPDKQNAGGSKQATKRKSEADGPENDPNATKKQPNYCPEHQLHVCAETNSENGIEPSNKEVMQLAQRSMWQLFMRSKEKSAVQMSQYKTLKKE